MIKRLWARRPRFFNNPIILRELVVQLRKPGSFLQLLFFLTVSSGSMIYIWYGMYHLPPVLDFYEEGRTTFYFMSGFLSILALLIIPMFSATQINLERERDTWDLLISSPLNAATILFGKFLSSILYIWLLFLAVIPVYSLSVTLGGVSPSELMFLFGIVTESAVVMAILGLICSIRYQQPMTAIVSTYLLAVGYFCLLPFIGLIKVSICALYHWPQTPFLLGLPLFVSPYLFAMYFFNQSIRTPGDYVHPWCMSHPFIAHGLMLSVSLIVLIAWALWGLSRLRRRSERRLLAVIRNALRKRERARFHTIPFTETEMFSERRNPVAQKDLREIHGPYNIRLGRTTALLVIACLLLLGLRYDPRLERFSFALAWRSWMPYLILWIYPFFLIPYAAGSMRRECDNNTWDLLRSTTLSPWKIVSGKFRGAYALFQWRFWAFYGLAFVIGVVSVSYNLFLPPGSRIVNPSQTLEFMLGSCFLIHISAIFYVSLGVYCSSRASTTTRAYIGTVIAVFFFFSAFLIVAALFGRTGIEIWNHYGYLYSPFVLSFGFDYGPYAIHGLIVHLSEWRHTIIFQTVWMVGFSFALRKAAAKRIARSE